MVVIKWSILITLEVSSFLHDKTFKLKHSSNLTTVLKSEVLDTHTFESRALRERILNTQVETERLNSPKSVVGLFDEIRCFGKASRVES